jgi:hypothetical protein
MKNYIYILITTVSAFIYNSYGQKTDMFSKNKTKYVEIDVIKIYERVALKGYKSVDMFKKIGNSYYANFEMEKAARWYCELFSMTTDLESKYYYQYEQSLRAIGQNDEADAIIEQFNQKNSKQ